MKREIYVVLDNIRSKENVGSIFRTSDAAGTGKIFLCGITPIPPDLKISKTALGAEKWVSWEKHAQTWRLLRELKLKDKNLQIVGLENTKESKNIFNLKPKCSVVIVLGNEVRGLSPKILKYCDKIARIPMRGKKESLNVAVAFGIAVYQILK